MHMFRAYLPAIALLLTLGACAPSEPGNVEGAPAVQSTSTTASPTPDAPGATDEPAANIETAELPQHIAAFMEPNELVIMTSSGTTQATLRTFDDPNADGDEVAALGVYLDDVAVHPSRDRIVYSTCCEPAAGMVHVFESDPADLSADAGPSSDDQVLLFGDNPSFGGSGLMAWTDIVGGVHVTDLDTNFLTEDPDADPDVQLPLTGAEFDVWSYQFEGDGFFGFGEPSLNAEGTQLAVKVFEQADEEVDGEIANDERIVVFDLTASGNNSIAYEVSGSGRSHPTFTTAGELQFVEQVTAGGPFSLPFDAVELVPGSLVVVDERGVEQTRTDLPVHVADLDHDVTQEFLLITGSDRSLHWMGPTGAGQIAPEGILAASW